MRLIFLDIDGVLCTMKSLFHAYIKFYNIEFDMKKFSDNPMDWRLVNRAIKNNKRMGVKPPNFSMKNWPFDKDSVKALNTVIRRTQAKIVVSSTWRLGETLGTMRKILIQNNIEDVLIGMTPNANRGFSYGDRGIEISHYLNNNVKNIYSYLVIDDEISDLQEHKNNLIQTKDIRGFTDNMVNLAIKILNKKVDNIPYSKPF